MSIIVEREMKQVTPLEERTGRSGKDAAVVQLQIINTRTEYPRSERSSDFKVTATGSWCSSWAWVKD